MGINKVKFAQVVGAAKAKAAGHARWINAIDRAAEGIVSGELIVTLLADGALVTSPRGTYQTNGACRCKAAQFGDATCYHRAAGRLMELYEAEPDAPAPCSPQITRSVERDVVTRRRVKVTRCDGWTI